MGYKFQINHSVCWRWPSPSTKRFHFTADFATEMFLVKFNSSSQFLKIQMEVWSRGKMGLTQMRLCLNRNSRSPRCSVRKKTTHAKAPSSAVLVAVRSGGSAWGQAWTAWMRHLGQRAPGVRQSECPLLPWCQLRPSPCPFKFKEGCSERPLHGCRNYIQKVSVSCLPGSLWLWAAVLTNVFQMS